MAKQCNADKAHRINDFLRAQSSRLIELGNELREIHKRYVIPFENKDDEFAHRTNELYRTYSTGWQRFRDMAADTGNFLADLIEGMLGATEALILGLIDLVDGMLTYVTSGSVVLFCAPFGIEPPSWASDHVSGVHNTVGTILNDPGIIFDALVLGAVDTWEEEGIGYSVGYVGLNIVTTVVTAGKIKAAKIKRLLKKGASWDELMRAGAKFDDLLRAGARFDDLVRAGAKFDDMIRAGAIVDDLVRIGASLDDLLIAGAKLGDLATFAMNKNWINSDSSIMWPPNNGAVPGTEQVVTLQPG